MAKLEDILEVHRSIADSLGQRMTEFENQLKSSSSSSSEPVKPNLEKLESEFRDFKLSVFNILDLLKSLTLNLATQIDDIDNHTRRNALLFNGIQESDSENLVSSIIDIVHNTIGLPEIQSSSIQYCHRLGVKSGNKMRPVLVRFGDIHTKSLIWSSKKKLKSSSVSISEFLTKSRQAIFSAARKHFGISSSWTHNGIVYVKLPNNDRKRLFNRETLDDLIKKFPKCGNSSVPEKGTVNKKMTASDSGSSNKAPSDRPPERSKKVSPTSGIVTRRNVAKKL
ncbi:uncharacterized protein LOC124542669 [Vanessa cardui]|uniref:uncharacterized protein LOC124542669 n=1 Tax=Vanessa cardui TaxID=171605 RepID=UPI001F137D9C|nr:uncharacterized protein LOC124542669 [Vanessa cardui]XP_046976552.1 uncharacterized protein LOC124542669 [Vanessa cardui]